MVRYRHPKHGFHIPSFGDDLAALKAAGWVPDEPASEPSPEPVVLDEPAPEPPAQPPRREPWRKRGR